MASTIMRCLGSAFGGGQDADVVAGLARRGDDLVSVGRNLEHARDDRVHRRRGFVVVIRER